MPVSPSPWLSPNQFSQACSALSLVSLNFCLLRHSASGPELLLGLRNNRPAQCWWFTPGGRIRKNEPLPSASARIALNELGLSATVLPRARLIGKMNRSTPMCASMRSGRETTPN